jgi:hypothetical protein
LLQVEKPAPIPEKNQEVRDRTAVHNRALFSLVAQQEHLHAILLVMMAVYREIPRLTFRKIMGVVCNPLELYAQLLVD